MWDDHCKLRSFGHEEARAKKDKSDSFFLEHRNKELRKRVAEMQSFERTAPVAVEGWRTGRGKSRREEHNNAVEVLAAGAADLPTLLWEATSEGEWEDKLRDGTSYRIQLPWDTELLWYPHWLRKEEADAMEEKVYEKVTMYHPTYQFQTHSGIVKETINRKGQAKICDEFNFAVQYSSRGQDATYSENLYLVDKMESWSRSLLRRVETAGETVFNAIWFNHYRDGTVTIQWHTDSDAGLGPDPIIGSMSLGCCREFCLKSKRPWLGERGRKGIIHLSFPLMHGSLLVMGRNSQRHWLHAVPAMEGARRERLNLTFRFYALDGLQAKMREASKAMTAEEQAGEGGKAEDESVFRRADKQRQPMRLRITPAHGVWQSGSEGIGARSLLRPVLVDAPADEKTTVGELEHRLLEHVLPAGLPPFRLALAGLPASNQPSKETVSSSNAGCIDLQQEAPLLAELERLCLHGQAGTTVLPSIVDLVAWPRAGSCVSSVATARREAVLAWRGMLRKEGDVPGGAFLQLELGRSPPGPYLPMPGPVDVPAGGDWISEVIGNLSGIQRKKRSGQPQQIVFHQCSEFVALYPHRPKSSVHLVLAPKRRVWRDKAGSGEAPLLRRLEVYAAHLVSYLQSEERPVPFAVGLRVRRGLVQHLHAHLLSMDMAAPNPQSFEKCQYLDFTGGPARFLSLRDAVDHLAKGKSLALLEVKEESSEPLRCHRCHQFFGDAVLELWRHLGRCEAWTPVKSPSLHQDYSEALALLEEMGFGSCGHDALLAALVAAHGSIEHAVSALTTH